MDSLETANKIMSLLELVRQRPGMHIGPVNAQSIQSVNAFIAGVYAASALFGFEWDRFNNSSRQEVVVERGWENESGNLWYTLQQSGMSFSSIVDEMLMIEIETLKRYSKAHLD